MEQQAVNSNGTLNVKQVIGDGNLTYVLMEFAAPDGTVLNQARYSFEDHDFDAGLQFYSMDFITLSDEDSGDNKISLVMRIMTKKPLAGPKACLKLTNLRGAALFPGEFKTVLSGRGKLAFALDFWEYSTDYPVNQPIQLLGYESTLKSIAVSPISIAIQVESPYLKEISQASGRLKEVGPNEYRDSFPGMLLAEWDLGQMLPIKTFEQVINDKEIKAIKFFDASIPIAY